MPVILVVSQFIGCVISGLLLFAIVATIAKKTDTNPFGNSGNPDSEE